MRDRLLYLKSYQMEDKNHFKIIVKYKPPQKHTGENCH